MPWDSHAALMRPRGVCASNTVLRICDMLVTSRSTSLSRFKRSARRGACVRASPRAAPRRTRHCSTWTATTESGCRLLQPSTRLHAPACAPTDCHLRLSPPSAGVFISGVSISLNGTTETARNLLQDQVGVLQKQRHEKASTH